MINFFDVIAIYIDLKMLVICGSPVIIHLMLVADWVFFLPSTSSQAMVECA